MSTPLPLVAIVSYSRRERPFIGALLRNALLTCESVVVAIGSRLFGRDELEDVAGEIGAITSSLDASASARVSFVVYDVPSPRRGTEDPIALHNLARETGYRAAIDRLSGGFWALFLDADEIPDGPRFSSWWRRFGGVLDPGSVYKLSNVWAFLHPRLVSREVQDSVVLAHSSVLSNANALRHARERDGIYLWHQEQSDGRRIGLERCVGTATLQLEEATSPAPLFWHFSWVRGCELDACPSRFREYVEGIREGLKDKCRAWGHRGQRDWERLIDGSLDAIAFVGQWPERDFVHDKELCLCTELPGCFAPSASSSSS